MPKREIRKFAQNGDSYASFAEDYHWLIPNEREWGESFVSQHKEILHALSPDATILDCACGIGLEAIALANHGFHVWASDGSDAMVSQACERVRLAKVQLPLTVCTWDRLPECYDQQFDLVLCTGNSIVHAGAEDRMLSALRGMWSVMKKQGKLVLTSRNWEKLHKERPRIVVPNQPSEADGQQCVPLYIWTFSEDWDKPHTVEIVLLLERGERTTYRRHEITYFPFRLDELVDRLEKVGFTGIETDYASETDWYSIVAYKKLTIPSL